MIQEKHTRVASANVVAQKRRHICWIHILFLDSELAAVLAARVARMVGRRFGLVCLDMDMMIRQAIIIDSWQYHISKSSPRTASYSFTIGLINHLDQSYSLSPVTHRQPWHNVIDKSEAIPISDYRMHHPNLDGRGDTHR